MRSFAWLVILLVVGCDREPTAAATDASAPSAAAPQAFRPGDDVVVARGVAFTQGRVQKVTDDEVTLEFGPPDRKTKRRKTMTVPVADAYPPGGTAQLAAGDAGACRVQTRKSFALPLPTWHPCEVLSVELGKAKARDHRGTEYVIDPADFVKPAKATAEAVRTFIASETKLREFDVAFAESGKPARPEAWVPQEGKPVLARWTGSSWYSARVVSVDQAATQAVVHVDGGQWQDRRLGFDLLAPVPESAAEPQVGQFLILRPKDNKLRWEPAKVKRVEKDAAVVVDRTGKEQTVPKTDLLPFAR